MNPPEHPRSTDLTVNVTNRPNRPHRRRFLNFYAERSVARAAEFLP
jgi:hypothetical protein